MRADTTADIWRAALLHRCIPSLMHCCIAASLHSFIDALLHRCIAAFLNFCIAASLHRCIASSLHCCIPSFLHCCIACPHLQVDGQHGDAQNGLGHAHLHSRGKGERDQCGRSAPVLF